jgi:hypothetical protein
MKRVYFSHSKRTYNTTIETEIVEVLRKYFPDDIIIDPNNDLQILDVQDDIMRPYLKIVTLCDVIVVHEC